MILKKIVNVKPQKLSKVLTESLGVKYNLAQRAIRNKDVKVQGVRVGKDVCVGVGELVEVFLPEEKCEIIFDCKDLLVAFKPRAIETVNERDDDFKTQVQRAVSQELFAVHRLDRNTEGLVIFAKNERAKCSLDNAIKNRNIEKYYLAEVVGVPAKSEEKLVAFLNKDGEKAKVSISEKPLEGYEEIRTNFKVLKTSDIFSVLEVELVTGKTHQIRAHLSFCGYPILGDEKYGNNIVNKKHNKKNQCLFAYKLVFHFEKDDYLSYLNGKIIELDKNLIAFYKNFK